MSVTSRTRIPRLIRNSDGGDLLESFLVSGIAAVLGIRFYLIATGYPQVGGGGLHVAHLLWGGLLMVIAVVGLLAFLGKRVQSVMAVVAGLGFGTFIDEIGKFLTSDNNYFFRPAIALIYIVFVALFLAARAIERRAALTELERLANSLDLIREGAIHGLTPDERDRAGRYLQTVAAGQPLAAALQEMLAMVPDRDEGQPGPLPRLMARGRAWGRWLAGARWFPNALIVFFSVDAVLTLSGLIVTIVTDPAFRSDDPAFSFVDWGGTLATLAVTGMVLTGIVRLGHSRVSAYEWFKRATLTSIMLVQVFAFYREQLVALSGLAQDVLVLLALNYLLHHDSASVEEAAEAPTPARATGPLRHDIVH